VIEVKTKKPERQMRKVAVRKAGPVRLTSETSAAYIPWDCIIVLPN